jgi:hypothetical protein
MNVRKWFSDTPEDRQLLRIETRLKLELLKDVNIAEQQIAANSKKELSMNQNTTRVTAQSTAQSTAQRIARQLQAWGSP